MSKQEKKSSEMYGARIPMPSFPLGAFNGAQAESYAKAGQTFIENALGMNQEVMRFAEKRVQNDVAALQALCECKNWQDAVALQSKFFLSATEDYQAQMRKLWEQGSQATSEITGSLQEAVTVMPNTTSGVEK